VLRSGFIVAFYTLLSRILGMAREIFVSNLFGSGPIADSVNVAFKLPNLFRRIFAEGALASVFVPIFSSKLLESQKSAEKFASKVFWLLIITLICVILMMQYFMPELMIIMAPGFHDQPEKFDLTILLCRITMPYLLFISIASFIGGMLNSIGRFASFSFAPILLNIAVIFGTMGLSSYMSDAIAISYSIIIGGILQIAFMIIAGKYANLHIRSTPDLLTPDKDINKLLRMMVPATISSGSAQISIFISQSIASFIPGAVSILSYAERIYQFPLSIIGTAFGTVLLPKLSKLYKTNDLAQIDKTQNNAIKFALFLSLPCALGIMALADPIIYLIYERGAFTAEDTVKTADALAAFALGLPAFILAKIFTPIFYANCDTKTPMKLTIYGLIVNSTLNIILMQFIGHIGIALGSSIAAWFYLYLLIKSTHKNGLFRITTGTKLFITKIFISSLIMAAAVAMILNIATASFYSTTTMLQILYLMGFITLGATIYFSCGVILGTITKDLMRYKNAK
jgi:putative peptidoglycan lipid II flippase